MLSTRKTGVGGLRKQGTCEIRLLQHFCFLAFDINNLLLARRTLDFLVGFEMHGETCC